MSLSKLANCALLSNATQLAFLNQCSRKSTLHILKTVIETPTKFPTRARLTFPSNATNVGQIRSQNSKAYIKLIDKRLKNLSSRENWFSSEVTKPKIPEEAASKSIFKRFKDAYKQHGKVLIYVHIATCFGWVLGFFALSNSGYDITNILNFFETAYIISHETNLSILSKIENFNMENFLRGIHVDYVLSDNWIQKAGELVTGNTLKHILTAIMLYKIFTPLRYLLTLTLTKTAINVFKTKGIIPKKPPPGYSIQEMYDEKKFVYQKRLSNQRERYLKEKQRLKSRLEKSQQEMKKKFKN